MAKPANKTRIGLFVVGAVSLAILAVAIFGSGSLFANKRYYVMFFDGTVKGLNVGSPVMFHGVRIGSVTDISLIFNSTNMTVKVPVIVAFEPGKVTRIGGSDDDDSEDYIKKLVSKGLRAQLQLQSFVTGQLMIAIDFFPSTPANYVGLVDDYPEIPTTPSSMEQITKTLENLPIQEFVTKLTKTIDGLNTLVNSPEAMASLTSVKQGLHETAGILKKVNSQIEPIIANLSATTASLKSATCKVDTALSGTNGIPEQLTQTLAAARKTLADAQQALTSMESATSENSVLMNEVGTTLDELSQAARSIRVLSDYLEQHPDSVIWGK
ncbi:MAG: MlaD family protein [Geobacteraceae bacterium]|nr:MlaD family protein [Geobacteraceae bacterium]